MLENEKKWLPQMEPRWYRNIQLLLFSILYSVKEDPAKAPELFEFYIDALGRELEGFYSYYAFQSDVGVNAERWLAIPGLQQAASQQKSISLERYNVATIPWNISRIMEAQKNIQERGYDPDTYQGVCRCIAYPELNFAIVSKRHHHTAAARAQRSPFVAEVSCFNLCSRFQELRVSGSLRWCDCSGNENTELIPDPRFALMYELARQKHLLLTLGKDRYMSSESGYSSFVCYAKNVTPRYTEIGLSPWQSFLFRLAKVKVLENGRIVIPQSI